LHETLDFLAAADGGALGLDERQVPVAVRNEMLAASWPASRLSGKT